MSEPKENETPQMNALAAKQENPEKPKKTQAQKEKESLLTRKIRLADRVIYTNQEGHKQAAIVTALPNPDKGPQAARSVGLTIFTMRGRCVKADVPQSKSTTGTPGAWQFPL